MDAAAGSWLLVLSHCRPHTLAPAALGVAHSRLWQCRQYLCSQGNRTHISVQIALVGIYHCTVFTTSTTGMAGHVSVSLRLTYHHRHQHHHAGSHGPSLLRIR